MKRTIILSLLLTVVISLAMVSCTDEIEELMPQGTPPGTSQTLGNGIAPYAAKSFGRNIYLLCKDHSSKIKVYGHNYDDIKDGFPTLKKISTLNVDEVWGPSGEFVTWGEKLFCVYHNIHTFANGEYADNIVSYEIIPGKDEFTPPVLSGQHMGFLPISGTANNESGALQFSLAEVDGYVYAAIREKSTNKVKIYRTSDTTPTHKPSWVSLGYIQKGGSGEEEKFGKDEQFELISGTVFEEWGMVSRLYFCRQKSKSHLEIYCLDDDHKWKHFQTDISSNLTGVGTFDVVQGSIENSGQDIKKVPIQLICSKGDYIVSKSFYPENGGEWGPLTYLKNHNGNMVATMGITTNDNNSAYYTHLYTFVGNYGLAEQLDVDRYQSNTIQVQSIHKSLLGELKTDSTIRSMCTLIGVIEGPPPTMLTNEADFDAITNFNYPQLILRSSSIQSCEFTHGFNGGISVYGGYKHSTPEGSKKGGSTFAAQLGFNFNYEYENKEEKLVHVDKELIFNTSYESRKYAYLIYLVPNVVTKSLFMSVPMNPEQTKSGLGSVINSNKIWEDAFQYQITHEEVNVVYLQVDITSDPFGIKDPNDLRSWVGRIDQEWDDKYQTPLRSVQVVLDGALAAVQIGGSASITNTHKWDLGFKFSAEMAKKFGIKDSHTVSVGGEIHGDYVGSKTTKNELSTDITMKYPMIESKKLTDTSIKEFFSSFMISYDKRSDAALKYYKPLIDLGYMLENEEPWILQYQAEIIR